MEGARGAPEVPTAGSSAWPDHCTVTAYCPSTKPPTLGVGFVPASQAERYAGPEIARLPVADLSPSTVAVAWPEDSRSLGVAAFVRAACAMAGREPTQVARLA